MEAIWNKPSIRKRYCRACGKQITDKICANSNTGSKHIYCYVDARAQPILDVMDPEMYPLVAVTVLMGK